MSSADSKTCNEAEYRQMIDEVLLDELPAKKWEKLRKHLAVCPVCRARYNKAVWTLRMLDGGPEKMHEPSASEFDRIGAAVLAPEGGERSAMGRMLQWFAPTQRWATGLVAAAAAIVLIPILAHMNQTKPPTEEFQPRGGGKTGPVELFGAHPAQMGDRMAGLRLFCLTGDKVEALDPKGNAAPKCARSSQMKLAVSNPGKFQRVFLVGVDNEHALKWYAPRPPETESVAAPDTSKAAAETPDVPVGATIRLHVNHDPGPIRVYALFSDAPVKSSEVEAATKEFAAKKVAVTAPEAEVLPLKRPDVLQRSLVIDVGP
jgi:hypothetical protein